ncbi:MULTISPECIES: 3-keto-5-aminohexanoate cleavage protein [Brucella]|uniref:3-keto-5-aminohexanoate cleavage protein n=1 Tax=Brucella TaxID=234 RepID=UPI000CFDD78B|nr:MULTISPECIES: 3-keto-5-aminohexanoate cleavage protein [Brucella]MQP42566.1 3-keto-5-aminohexanoate cleavage protein [Ochrobactrum sp. MYb237]PQZ40993.1 NADPH dependent quinone reductase [Brucella pseudogrignonensis]PRA37291.1 NADPH dependent quinone reductase [Brucella pseudogrignonensis]PRA62197.1 NADPH dependent quinone reductase [Brucella pseudogrignonensis]
MNWDVFITCAVTGSGATAQKSDKVPVTPKQIAEACVEAAKAGAAIAHIHVRNPENGAPSRDPAHYREVVSRVRDSGTDIVLNLTAGMGGDLVLGSPESPLPLNENQTDIVGATERLVHVEELLPEICTLDCGTMNFAEADYVMTNTPGMLRAMAARIQAAGVKPEIEVFDTGHLVLAKQLVKEGLIDDPVMIQLCMGIPYGAPDDPNTMMAMVNNVPQGWTYSAFSIGRMQLPFVAMAALTGANVRVGLEDNLMLSRGNLATNGQLVERAATILSAMNANLMSPAQVREKLKLKKRW